MYTLFEPGTKKEPRRKQGRQGGIICPCTWYKARASCLQQCYALPGTEDARCCGTDLAYMVVLSAYASAPRSPVLWC
eukprot:1992223-Rhodomonas_salina.1